jgi:hypothetical protein
MTSFYGFLISGKDFANLSQGIFSLEIEKLIIDFNDEMTNIDLGIIADNNTPEIDLAYKEQYSKSLTDLIIWFNQLPKQDRLNMTLFRNYDDYEDLLISIFV